jgi:hypothetical protein
VEALAYDYTYSVDDQAQRSAFGSVLGAPALGGCEVKASSTVSGTTTVGVMAIVGVADGGVVAELLETYPGVLRAEPLGGVDGGSLIWNGALLAGFESCLGRLCGEATCWYC